MNRIDENFYNLFAESKVLIDEPLSKYTNTKTGGPADLLAFPRQVDELKRMIIEAKKLALPVTVIGNASNLIVRDGGIRGLVLILVELNKVSIVDKNVTAEAGASLIDTTEAAYRASLSGLEFAAGIPGSVGGAIFMNAGAYGGEISEVADSVTILTRNGEIRVYQNGDLDFGYRHSRIQDENDIVLSANFKLQSGDKKDIREKMDDFNFLRASKQPLEYPSCGSVFKRPKGHFTGKLIHDAGLQGFRIGGAQVSLKHAGFIVNIGFATASDYLAVIKHIQKTIYAKFQVQLETEVRIIGENN
ncbi:UDP-N-acetylenolpyruvoylglucosamine reductase [Liquorilactobacillus sucicola DSM 21376 = JCM 15457]|uniref:UDP-N-acetylenolpyruvoylglucosamine reductase n=1 Tax=Liquorilactobacillus sucicola DSM 21376 = JCM 15457 TaxID=1423806 RepID=A0A023CZZ7_9LACO|nr:UDP-N-acetylmuramate dehydrogenase [Liquorilactobacillus sucicola]KRN06385.1 murB protein [Liquorilactobacillus sucicola DSM 21376 = JCM 15457]GAJ27488.1 UDP-N-acetylenolpyruvoylglucosamine reductase [Liquorilactobacillus sucicola DSM 21376 = JCM 15457]